MSLVDLLDLIKSCAAGLCAAGLIYWHSSRQTRELYEQVQRQLDRVAEYAMRDRDHNVVRQPLPVQVEAEDVERAPLPRAQIVRRTFRAHRSQRPS